ncbi:hypothetical protein JQ604_16115 [Bradyrhizobium jicamae]|uniref:hypothetical protein n=1 Tax=Bradyrhizobium jicamae TaxID=280332 RepID=UPI001BA99B82|nr:hypothetical protein [Bradyrhizobium jicamae]MBR0753714.1 hypothetical protein [Bradyrhizobium jicamae]
MIRVISTACVAVLLTVPTTASFGRGGGSQHGTSGFAMHADVPGTNALGTAQSSSGTGNPTKGVAIGTDPAIARMDATVDKMVKGSICRGC